MNRVLVVELGDMQPFHITPQILREIREKLDLTQPQAAERCRVTRRTWLNWENGHTPVEGPATIVIELLYAEANRVPARA
jgi:DNA-binding transcriptional regulator YiaG